MIKWERSFLMSMRCSSPVQAINVAYLFLTLSKWKWANVEMVKSPLFCDLNQWPVTFTFQCDLWLAEFESVALRQSEDQDLSLDPA